MSEGKDQVQRLIVRGDNLLKHAGARSRQKARATFIEARELARNHGLGEQIDPLIELRLAEIERLDLDAEG